MQDKEFSYVTRRVETLLGLNLNCYKPAQMRRRLQAFIDQQGGLAPAVFCKRLESDPILLDALRDHLTINVTEFFRDPVQWRRMESTVLPEISKRKRRLKIWSAGCSHGGEPYSVAMILARLGLLQGSQILATDYDLRVLERARRGGPYGESDVRSVPEPLLKKHFRVADDGSYYVTESIQQRVQFQELNLLRGGFSTNFDLILCRNVVIYFEESVKESLFERFRASLVPGGTLFIGATESILGAEALGFERMGGNFYRKLPAAGARGRNVA